MHPKNIAVGALALAKRLQSSAPSSYIPPSDPIEPQSESILPRDLLQSSRGYLENMIAQINGCYENAWYDSCAAMMRRLTEILLIEAYIYHGLENRIQSHEGNYRRLSEIIGDAKSGAGISLAPGSKKWLPSIKEFCDLSVHGHRYSARRSDIEKISIGFRATIEDLLYCAGINK
jgi:hypothetical protein